jgi:hypothetical protein
VPRRPSRIDGVLPVWSSTPLRSTDGPAEQSTICLPSAPAGPMPALAWYGANPRHWSSAAMRVDLGRGVLPAAAWLAGGRLGDVVFVLTGEAQGGGR